MELVIKNGFIFKLLELRLEFDLNPAVIQETFKKHALQELLTLLNEWTSAAIDHLKNKKYEIPAQDFENLCRHNYSDLLNMRDRLFKLQRSEIYFKLDEAALSFYHQLNHCMDQVFKHLENMGICTLEDDAYLPDFMRESRQESLTQQLNLFRAKCTSRSVHPEICNQLISFLHFSVHADLITQQKLHYAEKLIAVLLPVFTRYPDAPVDLLLMEKMLRMNFNAAEFYIFYTEYISLQLEESIGTARKCLVMNHYCKSLKQTLLLPDMALEPGQMDLKSLLLNYMEQELAYLEKKRADEQYHQQLPDGKAAYMDHAISPAEPGIEKITINANIREIGLLLKTMTDGHTLSFGTGGLKAFCGFMAGHFNTPGREAISANSLWRKCYDINPATVQSMIKTLEDLLRRLKQNFGA